jgi:hypothetical protein
MDYCMSEIRNRISGEFNGYDDGAVFRLDNGQVWQQKRYKYKYKYKYRPTVRIYESSGRRLMEVDCMDEPVEVVRVGLVEDGAIISDFCGFKGSSKFQFQNGHVWQQVEYKYSYHYAYRPHGGIVDGINGLRLSVEGMSESVRVRRVE